MIVSREEVLERIYKQVSPEDYEFIKEYLQPTLDSDVEDLLEMLGYLWLEPSQFENEECSRRINTQESFIKLKQYITKKEQRIKELESKLERISEVVEVLMITNDNEFEYEQLSKIVSILEESE